MILRAEQTEENRIRGPAERPRENIQTQKQRKERDA